MDPPRPPLLRFLHSAFPGARVAPMAGDASTRRFFRLHLPDGGSRVVMDYGAPVEGKTDDVRLTEIFREAGLPVARIFHVAPEPGCLVVEDLGDCTMESSLLSSSSGPGAGDRREEIYRRAVRLAVDVAVRGTPPLARSERAGGPVLDRARFRFEMDFYLENYAGRLLGHACVPEGVREDLHELADRAAETPRPVLCHRDFHSRNLMVLPDRSLAMVDIQDARFGPDTYDLASLLRDAYVDVPEDLVDRMMEAYRTGLPDPPGAEEFRARFHQVGAQRMIKALGTFGYQAKVLGRERYLDAVPRTLERLRRLLSDLPVTRSLGHRLEKARLLSLPGD